MHPFSSNSRPAPQSSQNSARRSRVSSKDPTSCIPRSMLSEFPSAATVPTYSYSSSLSSFSACPGSSHNNCAISPTSYSSSAPVFSVCIESSHNKRPLPLDGPPADRPLRKRRRHTPSAISAALRSAIGFLESEFEGRKVASANFPPVISNSVIRSSITKFDNIMTTSSRTSVCASCGELVRTAEIYSIGCNDARLHVIGEDRLDSCGHQGSSWNFCPQCFSALSQSKIPKFSAANRVNVTPCQSYPSVLEDLTVVEESLIARCHPVGAVYKMRPGGRASTVNYYALRGHMIVIPLPAP
jgi:hypothetical protein